MHVTAAFNVRATINETLRVALNALSLPPFLPRPTIVFNWAEIQALTPCFSIAHMNDNASDNYQGRGDGTGGGATVRMNGMFDISAWVNREDDTAQAWAARLAYMQDMITATINAMPVIVIKDYNSSLTAPPATLYKVNLKTPQFVQTTQDPNPAIERYRALVGYFWDLRV